MASPMFARVTLSDLAGRSQAIEFTGKLKDFPRLAEVVETDLASVDESARPQRWRDNPVAIRLRFGRADTGATSVEGQVSTTIPAVCQRCLDPFELALGTPLRLLLTGAGAEVADREDFEVWEFDEHTVSPADIVEEALILALPFSALHPSSDACGERSYDRPAEDGKKSQPFADLRSLLADAEEKD